MLRTPVFETIQLDRQWSQQLNVSTMDSWFTFFQGRVQWIPRFIDFFDWKCSCYLHWSIECTLCTDSGKKINESSNTCHFTHFFYYIRTSIEWIWIIELWTLGVMTVKFGSISIKHWLQIHGINGVLHLKQFLRNGINMDTMHPPQVNWQFGWSNNVEPFHTCGYSHVSSQCILLCENSHAHQWSENAGRIYSLRVGNSGESRSNGTTGMHMLICAEWEGWVTQSACAWHKGTKVVRGRVTECKWVSMHRLALRIYSHVCMHLKARVGGWECMWCTTWMGGWPPKHFDMQLWVFGSIVKDKNEHNTINLNLLIMWHDVLLQ